MSFSISLPLQLFCDNLSSTMYSNGWNTSDGSNDASNFQEQQSSQGVTPFSSSPSVPSVQFYITSFTTPILNCTVLGPDQRPLMYVVTDPQMPGYTFFRSVRGQSIALIEWQNHPLVEVNGVLSKRRVKDWLKLSPDRRSVLRDASRTASLLTVPVFSSRIMEVSAMQYTWAPQNQHLNVRHFFVHISAVIDHLCLQLCLGTSRPQLLGRVFRSTSTITIEMFSEALQLNILESAIVATVLLQCGRNID